MPCAAHVPPRCRGGGKSVCESHAGLHAVINALHPKTEPKTASRAAQNVARRHPKPLKIEPGGTQAHPDVSPYNRWRPSPRTGIFGIGPSFPSLFSFFFSLPFFLNFSSLFPLFFLSFSFLFPLFFLFFFLAFFGLILGSIFQRFFLDFRCLEPLIFEPTVGREPHFYKIVVFISSPKILEKSSPKTLNFGAQNQ